MRRFLAFLTGVICLSLAAGGLTRPMGGEWSLADLRWLGKADAPTPATDLVAVYIHASSLAVDLRFDLLDLNPGDPYHFHLSLWDNRGFAAEPLQIDLASDGSVRTTSPGHGAPMIRPRVTKDYDTDTINISLNRFLLGSRLLLDAEMSLPGSSSAVDKAVNVRSDGLALTRQAPVLIAFTDVFPAETPVQALRRWDGAHTGPLGDRDGLRYVVDAVKKYHLPVALLDLKWPASLAALSYLDVLEGLRGLYQNGRLILPEDAYAEPTDMALAFSRRSAAGFGLPGSQFAYAASGELQAGYAAQYVPLADSSHLSSSGGMRLIPMPQADAVEATEDGPSVEVRRALVNTMLSPDPADLVVLGGDLPRSTWGQADMAGLTFLWLADHPWVWVLSGADLLAFPTKPSGGPVRVVLPASAHTPAGLADLERELRSAPDNPIRPLAWQMYLHLMEPASDPRLQALRESYLGQVNDLLAAARWADSPAAQAECKDAADAPGQKVCILASQAFYASFESNGARLMYLFQRDQAGVHQVIGPSSQFATGLGDPSEWDPENGEAADPNALMGAFIDTGDPWGGYTPAIRAGELSFTSSDGQRTKTFRLTQNGVEAEYHLSGSETVRIPLALDPQAFYSGPTDYRPTIGPHSWTWSLVGGISVVVQTDAQIAAQGFVASYPFLAMPEDPNLDYPSGHYLPFPLSLAVIQGEGDFKVHIGVK